MDSKKSLIFLIMIISLICIFPLISSEESIEVNYPQNVNVGEEFSVGIKLIEFNPDVYDIKIDILDSTGLRVSRIFTGGTWKSTYYFVNDAINLETNPNGEFMLRIDGYSGEAEITIKTRDSSENTKTFSGYKITSGVIQTPSESSEENESSQEIVPENNLTTSDENSDNIENTINSNVISTNSPNSGNSNQIVNSAPIVISSKNTTLEKSEQQKDIKTSDSKNNYINYGLACFGGLILGLFCSKLLNEWNKKRKNEFE